MKTAVLSDIHGNVFALDAVIEDLKGRGVEVVLNLGDILYGPLAPQETYERLREFTFTTISGNQDRHIAEASEEEIKTNATLKYVLDDLSGEAVIWLKSLPFQRQLFEGIYICHGSPKSDEEYLLENVDKGVPQVRSEQEIKKSLDGLNSRLVLCGHTHLPRTVMLSSGQLIVNPGSVGLPAFTEDAPVPHSMENNSPHASYAIIEKNRTGCTVEHIKVPYKHQKAVKLAARNKREDWVHYLSTGRGLHI